MKYLVIINLETCVSEIYPLTEHVQTVISEEYEDSVVDWASENYPELRIQRHHWGVVDTVELLTLEEQ